MRAVKRAKARASPTAATAQLPVPLAAAGVFPRARCRLERIGVQVFSDFVHGVAESFPRGEGGVKQRGETFAGGGIVSADLSPREKTVRRVEDNGRGFDVAQAGGERNGLTNMAQRMAEIGGTCEVSSQPGAGCLVVFTVPLMEGKRRWFNRAAENELK